MMTSWRRIVLVAGLTLGGIQLIPVSRTNPRIAREIDAPPAVRAILKRSCYACHSNETRWPWYGYVAPASWLVARDVRDGRAHLNFSDWAGTGRRGIERYLRNRIANRVEAREMPPRRFLLLHSEAGLSSGDAATLREWARCSDSVEVGDRGEAGTGNGERNGCLGTKRRGR